MQDDNPISPNSGNVLRMPAPQDEGYLSVTVHAYGRPLVGQAVSFFRSTGEGKRGDPVGQPVLTDAHGRASLPDPVEGGSYLLVHDVSEVAVGTVSDPEASVLVGLPAGGGDTFTLHDDDNDSILDSAPPPEGVELKGPDEDFKVLYDSTVKFVPTDAERFHTAPHAYRPPWWDAYARLVVVEAIEGTWLSKITGWYLGDPLKAYANDAIGLITKDFGRFLSRHTIDGASGDKPNLPDFYQKGKVPEGFDEWCFDPDLIYPGQRFALILPARKQTADFEEPTVVEAPLPPGFMDKVWAGVGVSYGGDWFAVGKHDLEACLFNMRDGWDHARYVWISLEGWKFGPGLGGSGDPVVVIAHGMEGVADFNEALDSGWDFDIALGPKLSSFLKQLKGVGKVVQSMDDYKKLDYTVQQAIKSRGIYQPGIYAFPIPLPVNGWHLWFGFKFGTTAVISSGQRKPSDVGAPPK